MTPVFEVFPDVEDLLVLVLDGLSPGRDVVTTLPPNLQDQLPLQRVRRIGGGGDQVTDVARVDVEAFASTRAAALQLARQQHQVLLSVPSATSRGLIDRVVPEVGPHELPYADPGVRLMQATYRISVRRWTTITGALPTYELPSSQP